MSIVSSLQTEVNRIVDGVDGSTSLEEVADVGISRRKADVAYAVRFMNALEFYGVLFKTDDEFDALFAMVVWKVYLWSLARYCVVRALRSESVVAQFLSALELDGVLLETDSEFEALVAVVCWKVSLWSLSRYRVVRALRSVGMDAQAENFGQCGMHVYNLECCRCGYVHEVMFHCKLRLCPSCGMARQYEMVGAWHDGLKSIGELRFATLTLKNVADLAAGVKKIRSCFAKLRHRKFYKARIWGGLYGIEAPVGADGLWNVHLHFVYGGLWIPQDKFAGDWEDITGDSRIVHIRKVKDADKDIRYIVKYACKVDVGVMEDEDKLGEYVAALYNVRLVQAFGTLLGRRATEEDTLFLCPECGECMWRVIEVATGKTVFDELEYMRSRASPVPLLDCELR